ncbi:MAG: SAM-dependent methyltransferase [Burkholderiales bacterium]
MLGRPGALRIVSITLLAAVIVTAAPIAYPESKDEAAKSVAAAEADTAKDVTWLPTPEEMVDALLRTARVSRRDVVIDLGSGDGRIPIAAAVKFGAQGIGIEFDPELIAASRKRADELGVADRVEFRQADLFDADISKATVVTLFLAEAHSAKLRPKLLKLKPGTRIASYKHGIPDWEPDEVVTIGDHKGMLWVVPTNVAGSWRLRLTEGRGARDLSVTLAQRYQRVEGDVKGAGASTELVKQGIVRGDRLSFLLAGESGDRSFFAQVVGEVMSGTVSDGVRGVRFRADRVTK